jgi:hypothetical protein
MDNLLLLSLVSNGILLVVVLVLLVKFDAIKLARKNHKKLPL